MFRQDDLGKDVDRSRKVRNVNNGAITRDDASRLQPADPLQARARRQSDPRGEILHGRATIALQIGQYLDVDPVQCRRTLDGHPHSRSRRGNAMESRARTYTASSSGTGITYFKPSRPPSA